MIKSKYIGSILSLILTLGMLVASWINGGWESLGFMIIAIMSGIGFVFGTLLFMIFGKKIT
jgi:hypothetical protein